MPSPKAVLDTNVLLQVMMGSSAAWTVMRACTNGRLKLVYSQKLMYEVEEKVTTNPRVRERLSPASFVRVNRLIARFGRCANDPRSVIPYSRIAVRGNDQVPDDPGDQFVYALARSTGSLIMTSDSDFDNGERLGIPRLGLYEAEAALNRLGGIQLALADRYGEPQLFLV